MEVVHLVYHVLIGHLKCFIFFSCGFYIYFYYLFSIYWHNTYLLIYIEVINSLSVILQNIFSFHVPSVFVWGFLKMWSFPIFVFKLLKINSIHLSSPVFYFYKNILSLMSDNIYLYFHSGCFIISHFILNYFILEFNFIYVISM